MRQLVILNSAELWEVNLSAYNKHLIYAHAIYIFLQTLPKKTGENNGAGL